MNLADQCASLELSRRLKELNVKQESLVYWLKVPTITHMKLNPDGTIFEDEHGSTVVDRTEYEFRLGSPLAWNISKEHSWSAFTCAELGMLLPDQAYTQRIALDNWECIYLEEYDCFQDSLEANARARMLIHLLENGLIKNDPT